MSGSVVFSILFLLAGSYVLVSGMYLLQRNPKAHINRLYMAIAIAIQLWSFGLAVSTSAHSYEISLVGRRVAALGWGSIHAILLRFFIELTENTRVLRKKWVCALLYAPAVVVICTFALPLGINDASYRLVQTAMGWANIAENNIWDWFYYVYYFSYTVIGLFLLWRWGKKTQDEDSRKKGQARLLIVTFVITALLTTVTDVALYYYVSVATIQMAPLLLLIPVITINYSIKKYGLMETKAQDNNEIILNDANRSKIARYISIALIVSAAAHVLLSYFLENDIKPLNIFIFSGFILICAMALLLFNRSKADAFSKEKVITLVASLVVPLVTLRFFENAASRYGRLSFASSSQAFCLTSELRRYRFSLPPCWCSFSCGLPYRK